MIELFEYQFCRFSFTKSSRYRSLSDWKLSIAQFLATSLCDIYIIGKFRFLLFLNCSIFILYLCSILKYNVNICFKHFDLWVEFRIFCLYNTQINEYVVIIIFVSVIISIIQNITYIVYKVSILQTTQLNFRNLLRNALLKHRHLFHVLTFVLKGLINKITSKRLLWHIFDTYHKVAHSHTPYLIICLSNTLVPWT